MEDPPGNQPIPPELAQQDLVVIRAVRIDLVMQCRPAEGARAGEDLGHVRTSKLSIGA